MTDGPVQPDDPQASPAPLDEPQSSPWAPGAPAPVEVPEPSPKRRPRGLLAGLGIGVLALALVITGFATRGFGLLPSAGSASPEEAALKVANKTVELVNSFSVRNLLTNPLTAMGSLDEEFAPSEAYLSSSFTTVDTSDLLGLTEDSVALLSDLVGSFKAEAAGLKTQVAQVTDEVAIVTFVAGTVTVTADTEKLRTALTKLPRTVDAQLAATAEKYGLHPRPTAIEDGLPANWIDDAVAKVEADSPAVIDLAEVQRQRLEAGDPELGSILGQADSFYKGLSRVAVVKEGGRWYLSPLLTQALAFGMGSSYLDDADAEARRAELKGLLAVAPSRHDSPVAAADAFAEALADSDTAAVLKELPLAERRLAAFASLAQSGSSSTLPSESGQIESVDHRFSESQRAGTQARLRIDELTVRGSAGVLFGIRDGSCVTVDTEPTCLKNLLDVRLVADAVDSLRSLTADSDEFEQETGIRLADLLDRLELAGRGFIKAIDPDKVGVIALQENGGWYVSLGATVNDLQSQLVNALVAGLKEAQDR